MDLVYPRKASGYDGAQGEGIKHQGRAAFSPLSLHSKLKLLEANTFSAIWNLFQKLEDSSLAPMCAPMRLTKEEPSELCHLYPRPGFKHEIKNTMSNDVFFFVLSLKA